MPLASGLPPSVHVIKLTPFLSSSDIRTFSLGGVLHTQQTWVFCLFVCLFVFYPSFTTFFSSDFDSLNYHINCCILKEEEKGISQSYCLRWCFSAQMGIISVTVWGGLGSDEKGKAVKNTWNQNQRGNFLISNTWKYPLRIECQGLFLSWVMSLVISFYKTYLQGRVWVRSPCFLQMQLLKAEMRRINNTKKALYIQETQLICTGNGFFSMFFFSFFFFFFFLKIWNWFNTK